MRTIYSVLIILLLAFGAQAVEHPYILWNAADIARMKGKLADEDWAKESYTKLRASQGQEASIADLFDYAVRDDAAAGQRQIGKLMATINSRPPLGGAQWLNVVRYDLLYDKLTDEQRTKTEKVFREYIDIALFSNAVKDATDGFLDPPGREPYSRYDSRAYGKSNWLPNIVFPRRLSANLIAVALGDEALVRSAWGAYGSFQWYMDEYLSDSGFYQEEFGKMGATPGEELLYCRGLQRLGLNELGFGYTGRNGATMRGHIQTLIRLGYPRVDLGTTRYYYPLFTHGDLRNNVKPYAKGTLAFQAALSTGYMPDGSGGVKYFNAPGAWGGEVRGDNPQWDGYGNFTPKMQIPLWFEAGYAQWPEDGYGYFLAQMRAPAQEQYIPTFLFGLDPIDPAKVKAPAAYSFIAPQRGLAMLRADESPAYWESAAPAVGLRLAAPYAHSTSDSFSMVGFFAYNRPIYQDRQVTPSYAVGWSRSAMSHNTVMVDGKEPVFTDDVRTREGFFPEVKFVAGASGKVFAGITQTRALMLTNEYLLDLFNLNAADGQPHEYLWMAHALGQGALTAPAIAPQMTDLAGPLAPFGRGQRHGVDATPWSATITQGCGLPDPDKAYMPKAWYERKVGVTLSMLGTAGTAATLASTPMADDLSKAPKIEDAPERHEVGGTSVLVTRTTPATTFAALHAPFEGGTPQALVFERLSEDTNYVAAKITGLGINDRAFVQFGDDRKPVTFADGDDRYAFSSYGFVRFGGLEVRVFGDVRGLKLKVADPKTILYINNRRSKCAIVDGVLMFGTV